MDQLIAFHRIFGSCVLGPPQKDYFFAVPWRGSFGRILTMQLEPPKKVAFLAVSANKQRGLANAVGGTLQGAIIMRRKDF